VSSSVLGLMLTTPAARLLSVVWNTLVPHRAQNSHTISCSLGSRLTHFRSSPLMRRRPLSRTHRAIPNALPDCF
jgi:hypothetical protein